MARPLLDENLPRPLARLLTAPHFVRTVQQMQWSGIRNGALLQRASAEFDVLITLDRGIPYQQSVSNWPIGLLVLRAKSNRLMELHHLVPEILSAINSLQPGNVSFVGP